MNKLIILCLLLAGLLRADDFSILIDYMTGSFSSQKQAEADSEFFDIRLEMVRIWPNRDDGVWLYVEQAAATRLDQPYRQRIYRVTQVSDIEFQSEIFMLTNPLHVAGHWKSPESFDSLSPAALEERQGCAVFLTTQTDGSFSGSTKERDCPSEHRGASYATSVVTIKKDQLISWDRGFDENGLQVWGAEKGGYIFDKIQRDFK